MRTTQAYRYARGSAILAFLLACFVGGTYIRHAWQAYKARASAPSAVPSAIQQQAAEFSFSKVNGNHPEFTVRASHATQFAEGGRSLLQDVWVTFYGQDGSRADNLHTRSCELLDSASSILCAGDVQIDLQSADDAKQFPGTPEHPNPGAHIMHIHTSHVSFDRGTGVTVSDQPVTFEFPQGHGRAVGLRYDSHQQQLRLLSNVDLNFQKSIAPGQIPAIGAANVSGQPLHVTASALDFRRDQRVINLEGPVDAQQGPRRLDAGHLAIELDPMLRARRVLASAKPRLTTRERPSEDLTVAADQFAVLLSTDGWVERLSATGNLRASAHSAQRDDRLSADRAEVEMTPRTNQPRSLTAFQNVVAQSDDSGGAIRQLMTSQLVLQFAPPAGDGQLRISSATTPAATLDWRIPANGTAKSPAEHMHLASQHLQAEFGPESELREIRGAGDVQIERQPAGSDAQTSTSNELIATLLPTGDWSTLDLSGNVSLRQADQLAHADTVHFDRLTDTANLKGSISLSDLHYRLTARSATFQQQTHEFGAQGDVVSSEVSGSPAGPSAQNGGSRASATDLAPGPARISANRLLLNTATGHAVYSDQARLWQGNSLIEADRIELDREAESLIANGHVRAVFPRSPLTSLNAVAPGPKLPLAAKAKSSLQAKQDQAKQGQDKVEFTRTEAGRLVYRSSEGRAVLDKGVISRSQEGSIQSDAMDLYFAPSLPSAGDPVKPAKAGAKSAASAITDPPPVQGVNLPTGAQQLVRATALGHVIVLEGDRRATANQADYNYTEGRFVLSGGAPSVRDSSGNSASGRQLTLFFADDRIVIDSAEGARTLTLHRVEK